MVDKTRPVSSSTAKEPLPRRMTHDAANGFTDAYSTGAQARLWGRRVSRQNAPARRPAICWHDLVP